MKRIICFGDSNTFGYIPGEGGRYDENIRWTSRLGNMLPAYEIVECGLNGRTTVFDDEKSPLRNGSKALGEILRQYDPADMFIIMLGTNDCKKKFAANEDMITGGLDIIISQIRLYNSDTYILIIAPPFISESVSKGNMSCEFDAGSAAVSRLLRDKYKMLAEKTGCGFISMCDYVNADETDGVHMNESSHERFADIVFEYISKNGFSDV